MSVPIVVDEWLFHDLLGENGSTKQHETFAFLNKLIEKCDKIVVLSNSPFEVKTKDLIRKSENDPVIRGMSQFFKTAILLNHKKTVLLNLRELKPLQGHLSKVPEADQYLFQAYVKLRNKGSFILTTDNRWGHNVVKKASVKMRDSFVPDYLKRT